MTIYDDAESNTGTLLSWRLNLINASGNSEFEDSLFNKSDLVLFPNPASDKVNLQSAVFGVAFFDLNGRQLLTKYIP